MDRNHLTLSIIPLLPPFRTNSPRVHTGLDIDMVSPKNEETSTYTISDAMIVPIFYF